MKKLLFFMAGLILLTACRKNDDPEISTQVNFSDLKVGQKSLYHAYRADCSDMNGTFEWTGSTLVLEVRGSASDLVLRELFIESPDVIPSPPVEYPVIKIESGVLLPDRQASRLFYFYGNDTLRLNPVRNVTLQQDECLLFNDEVFRGDDIGYLPIFEVGDVKVEDKTVVSCIPFELDAYLIYDSQNLHISHVVDGFGVIPDPTGIRGWYLIED